MMTAPTPGNLKPLSSLTKGDAFKWGGDPFMVLQTLPEHDGWQPNVTNLRTGDVFVFEDSLEVEVLPQARVTY